MRELEFVINSNDYAWARNMKRLLKETCAEVSSRKSKQLKADEYVNLQKRYRNIITRGTAELPARPVRPVRPSGKRGRLAQSDAQNLWDRLKTHEQAVLLFAKKAAVPITNNRAERDLRMGKVKLKVSGCFRQRKYAEAYCRISSYLQSMAYQGYNPLTKQQLLYLNILKYSITEYVNIPNSVTPVPQSSEEVINPLLRQHNPGVH